MVSSTAVVRGSSSQKKLPEAAVAAAYTAASRLMDGMLHDARNPLNALAINLEVLSEKLRGEDGEVPPSQDRNLKAMREQIFRVDAILRRFSDFIAPRSVAGGEVDLPELVLKALDVVGHDSRKRRVRIRQQLEQGMAVRCEELSTFHLLLIQPLLRALARAPANGEIEVTVAREDGRAVMRVTDAAGSIPEPHPEIMPALDTLSQHNGVQVQVKDGSCELSFALA